MCVGTDYFDPAALGLVQNTAGSEHLVFFPWRLSIHEICRHFLEGWVTAGSIFGGEETFLTERNSQGI